MAKQVSEILIKLGLQDVEGLDKLKSAFRELEKSIGPNNAAIERARQSIIDYGRDSRNTEQVIKGQIDALKGLQSQATRNSATYNRLSKDLIDLKQSIRLTDDEITKQANLLVRSSNAHTQSAASIQSHVKALQELRTQATLGGQAYDNIGAQITKLNTQLQAATAGSRAYRAVLGQNLSSNPEKLAKQVDELRQSLADSTNTAEQTGKALAKLAFGSTNAREQLLGFTKGVQESRAVIAQLGESFLDLPKTTAIYGQRLKELNTELDNTVLSSRRYYEILSDISTLQFELQRAQSVGRGQVLFERLSLSEGSPSRLASTQKNLGLVIGALREEMSMLDTSTAEGSALFAQQSRQVAELEKRLKALGAQYVEVGQAQATAAKQGVNPYLPSGAKNPLYDEAIAKQAVADVANFRESYYSTLDNLLNAKLNFRQEEAKQLQLVDAKEEEAHQAQMARIRAQADAEEQQFKRELQRLDLLAQQQKAAASALGLGGRELSPLYQGITNLASASVRREQSMMGRSATQVLTDMFTAFEKGGRGVDLKQKSTQIGESIAQGITAGASDPKTLNSGADRLSRDFITALKRSFKIKSPSGESRDQIGVPIGQGIGKGIVKGINEVRQEVVSAVRLLLSDLTAAPQRVALPSQQTTLSDKLQSFLARSSARTSTFLPFARLMGEEAVSSPALTLATYRRAYEKGGIAPSMYLPVEQRRNLRGVPGIPGYGLEQEIRAAAIRNVGRTGAFVGPLAGPLVSGFTGASSTGLGSGLGQGSAAFAGQLASLFAASSPVPARGPLRYGMAGRDMFPVEGMLGGGRSLSFGRAEATASTREAINSYRKAVANFWEGDTGTFETVRRIISSGVQLSASRLAKRLTDSVELPSFANLKGRLGAALPSLPSFANLKGRLGAALPSLPRFADVDERNFPTWKGAAGFMQLGGFPVSGMAQIGGVRAGGGSFVPMAGGGGGGRTGTPTAAAAPIPPSAPSDYDKLTAAVSRFGVVNKRSTEDLREFSSSLRGLQDILNPTASDFKQVNQVIEQQGRILDRELEKRQNRGANRLTAGQAVQAAGAAISGGIFGGPEGFLGGVGGAAIGSAIPGLGTVSGSFAGAAIGAQVGMFRQQIAGTADYAAQIGKLQIALRGIVGSQQAYDQAVQAAASATRDLNIPQQEATQGITRLSAAVLGAGGTVTDSAFAFRAMSEAVKATGGGAEQVDGALLALTQVFSKGKVSAEELNQIAERLPGTFTLFAQAAGKTGPELQKALEQGQIGLNDLMKFLTAVRDRYSSTALTVAGSSEEAGARLKIAFDEMRLEVGKALKSTGSDLQVAFAAFVKEITPAVVGAAKGLAASLKLITDNAATFKTLLEFAAALGTATLAINTFKAAATGIAALNIAGTLTTTAGAVKLTGDVMGVTAAKTGLLTGALTSLRVATVALATAWAAPLALTVAIVGGVATYNWIQKLKKATDDLKASTMQRTGESWLSGIGGTAASNAVVNRETSSQLMRVSSLQEKLAALNKERTALRPLAKNILSPDIAQNAQVELAAVEQRIKTTRLDLYAARRNAEVGLAEIAKRQRQGAGRGLTGLTQFAAPAEDKSADKAAKAQESLMRKLQSDFDSTITQLGRRFNAAAKDKLYETLLGYENKIQIAYRQNNLVLAEDLKLKQKAAALDITEEVLLSEKVSLQQKLAEARAKGLDAQAVQNRLDTVNAELKQINYDSTKETTTQLEKQATLATQIKEALTQAFAPTAGGPGRLLTSGVVGGVFPGAFTGEEESFKSLTDQRGIERIKELGKELQALTNPLSQILTAAEAIGSAFSSSFTSVISGTASTQEALASFFNNIANYFLDMAGKMIAKWIEMAILNTVLQLLPSGPKFGSSAAVPGLPGLTGTGALSPGGATSAVTSYAGVKFNALGNAYAANGIVPFAMGGIVNKPTLFRFANGGVPGTGLMGEAGPEAIMPLKRGPDGKLGVSGGGGVSVGEINITVQNSGETLSPAAQKQIANQVQGIVLTTLVNQKRSGGIL